MEGSYQPSFDYQQNQAMTYTQSLYTNNGYDMQQVKNIDTSNYYNSTQVTTSYPYSNVNGHFNMGYNVMPTNVPYVNGSLIPPTSS
ncbi:unnamed protein product [Macrosiphum euphorbiae]|uniref:Uncharacterized protein n=1 Tax=Macrosiphum euphorbiae TaxID=13131 RepID=A0AAV0WNU3_9HEMI|nr:unnamed protein product [Macrosiphum euphorbiae]